ncbi:MAG: hypothetical protein QG670_276 [Thermoproteota archaeon]|nr:hypothetical protein [Thermoproteota archaeon]
MEYRRFYPSSRRLVSYALVAIVIGSVFGGIMWNVGGVYLLKAESLTRFSSYQELVDFLKTSPQDMPKSLLDGLRSFGQSGQMWTKAPNINAFTSADVAGTSDYSTTNIQVEGVDEADIVKTDGAYIYLASGSFVYILRAYPTNKAELLSKLSLNATVEGIFFNGEKLVVFTQSSGLWTYTSGYKSDYGYYYYDSANASIRVYDVSNRSQVILERFVSIDGSYISSRMIGDYVYAIINKPAQVVNNNSVILPEVRSGNGLIKIEATSVYHPELPDYYYYFTNVVAFSVKNAGQTPKIESFLLGATSTVYVSAENIYLTSGLTDIHKINIKNGDIAYVADGHVSGWALNQYSMDEYNGLFRIATTNGTSNSVYILDEKLEVMGKLEGLAPHETFHSARFVGDRCYIVTFKKVDPLFVISLEDSKNPKVLGELKIPGYSDYLHPYDATHLIGVGKETVESETGSFAWYQGVKISLFDVSNVSQPREVYQYVIGDRGTDSSVLTDPKALLFSSSKQLLALPVLLAKINPSKYPQGVPSYAYGDYVWQGVYVFNVTLSEIVFKGSVTHLNGTTDLAMSYYSYSPYFVKRALFIGDVLYTVSDKMVAMNDLASLEELGRIVLP